MKHVCRMCGEERSLEQLYLYEGANGRTYPRLNKCRVCSQPTSRPLTNAQKRALKRGLKKFNDYMDATIRSYENEIRGR